MRLTTAIIKALALPAGVREKTFFDDNLGGFGLRLREGGAARYVVQYDLGGKTKRITLGTPTMLELGAARAKARDILASVRLGGDPAAEKRQAHERAGETFGALLTHYLPWKRTQLRARSFDETERHLVKYARPLHARPVTAIDRRALALLMSAITARSGPVAANCMHASLSGYFTWLIREGLIDVNPAAYVNKAPQNRGRDRVLSPDELRAIWNALGDSDYADIVRLLIYTGARKSELGAGLRWDEIDLENAEINLPAARTKNDKPHVIPLSAPALAILKARPRNGRDFVFGRGRGFSGWNLAKKALDARIAARMLRPITPWVLHDLRRTFSTRLHELGVPPHVVEAALGHVSGFKSGVAGTYNKAEYLDERRRALKKWATFVDETVTGKQPAAKVVRLRK